MLGAVMFGHKSFQPVIEAIIRWPKRAAKEPRDFTSRKINSELRSQDVKDMVSEDLKKAYKITGKKSAVTPSIRRQGQGEGSTSSRKARTHLPPTSKSARSSSLSKAESCAAHPRDQVPHRRP
jgi:polyribonucleotide nucleotidyltransferase